MTLPYVIKHNEKLYIFFPHNIWVGLIGPAYLEIQNWVTTLAIQTYLLGKQNGNLLSGKLPKPAVMEDLAILLRTIRRNIFMLKF